MRCCRGANSERKKCKKGYHIFRIWARYNQTEARLQEDKIQKWRGIKFYLSKENVTDRELHSLIGLLNFACNIIVPGRAFLRRLINLTIGIINHYYRIRLTKVVNEDLHVWLQFLINFNSKCMFLPDTFLSSGHLMLYTDASGAIGYAAIFGGQYVVLWALGWPVEKPEYSSAGTVPHCLSRWNLGKLLTK